MTKKVSVTAMAKAKANWRDTFTSKTEEGLRIKRLAEQQQAQSLVQSPAQYAAINRGSITTVNKQATSQKLLAAVNSDGPAKYEALAIVRILINFKSNEKKGGDANQAGIALTDLERHVKVMGNMTAQELMEFVKNRNAFFQRQIPDTFKKLLIIIMPININALVTAENGQFLLSNGVIDTHQLTAILNRQNEVDPPPLDKIATLFYLISRRNPSNPFIAQTFGGAMRQSAKDGFRGLYKFHPSSVKHLFNLMHALVEESEKISARQEDSRLFKTQLGAVFNSKGEFYNYVAPQFTRTTNTGFVNSEYRTAMTEILSNIKNDYTGPDGPKLIRYFKRMMDGTNLGIEQPIDLSGTDYNGTWAYQIPVEGTRAEKGLINQINKKSAYRASRKSADLSNGPQIYGDQGNIDPGSINMVAQSGLPMGMEESALVVFSQNQCLTNKLSNSWSRTGSYFMEKTIDWDILTLLSEIAPDIYAKKRLGLEASVTFPQVGEWPRSTLYVKTNGIQWDFARHKERVVRIKCDNHWIWKNTHHFYETIDADVRITWNFRGNYVHYEILNIIHGLTPDRTVFPTNDPHLPRASLFRGY